MSSNQDPTSPTTGGTPHPGGSDSRRRPMTWIYATGVVLGWTGFLIGTWVGHLPSSGTSTPPWFTAGTVLVALSMFVFFTVPGAMLVTRHPWAGAERLLAERQYAHPRLLGLTQVWAGLVLSGSTGASLFAPDPFTSPYVENWSIWTIVWVLAIIAAVLVAFAPLLAFVLFDRRR